MSNAQKPNKHLRTKTNKKTTTSGARGNVSNLKHGKGKGLRGQDKKIRNRR